MKTRLVLRDIIDRGVVLGASTHRSCWASMSIMWRRFARLAARVIRIRYRLRCWLNEPVRTVSLSICGKIDAISKSGICKSWGAYWKLA